MKVGFATDPKTRLSHLQVGSPVRLWFIAKFPGTLLDEREIHLRLRESHSHGEWFWPSDALRDVLIEKCGRLPGKYKPARIVRAATQPEHNANLCVLCENDAERLIFRICRGCTLRLVAAHDASAETDIQLEKTITEQLEAAARKLEEARARRETARERLDESRRPYCARCDRRFTGSVYRHRKRCPGPQ